MNLRNEIGLVSQRSIDQATVQRSKFVHRAAPFALTAVFLLSACSDPSTADDGSIRGELDVYVANLHDGTSGNFYSLRTRDGQRFELTFDSVPKLEPGEQIRVWGTPTAGKLHVESFTREVPNGGLGVARESLIDAPKDPERSFAFVLVTLNGTVPELTPAEATESVITGATSFINYYNETSYGIQPFTAEIFSGPDFAHTMSGCSNNATGSMADDLRDAVDAAAGHSFDHYGWYFEGENGCGWSGLGQVGRASSPAEDTWYNGSDGCVVLAQEVGHNLAQAHSSAIDCGSSSFADNPAGSCQALEYGDRFDTMGGGCYQWTMFHKVHWNWARECNSVRVTATATFDVFPLEAPCNGIQTLQIPMPPRTLPIEGGDTMPSDFYYVEYRQPVGNFSSGSRGNVHDGVLIHAGIDYQPANQRGERPYLLDMTPGSSSNNRTDFEDAALEVGQTFTDPSGSPRIRLVSADSTKATVLVEIDGGSGNPTCLDGTEFAPPGPTDCTAPPLPPLPPTGGMGGMGGMGGTGTAAGGAAGSVSTGGVPTGGAAGSGAGGVFGTGGASSAGSPGVGGSFSSGGATTISGGAPNAAGGGGPIGQGAGAGPSAALDPDIPPQVVGTCACRTTAGGKGAHWQGGLALLGLLAFGRRRRKA